MSHSKKSLFINKLISINLVRNKTLQYERFFNSDTMALTNKKIIPQIINNLKILGLSREQLQKLERVYAPIGIDIGARSPQEIAVSILAQVIQVMNSSSR